MVLGALAFGVGQAALGFGGDLLRGQRERQQYRDQLKFQRKSQQFQLNQYNQQVDRENAYAMQAYEIMKQQGKKQKKLATQAANRAWLGNSVNRDRQLRSLAFDRNNRQAELMQALGAGYASMEGDNRSAMRALRMSTEGVAGRMDVQDQYRVGDINFDSKLAADDIKGQLDQTFAQINAQTAIAPFMKSHAQLGPQQKMPGGPSGLEMGLSGLTALMGGISTANSLLPSNKSFFR